MVAPGRLLHTIERQELSLLFVPTGSVSYRHLGVSTTQGPETLIIVGSGNFCLTLTFQILVSLIEEIG